MLGHGREISRESGPGLAYCTTLVTGNEGFAFSSRGLSVANGLRIGSQLIGAVNATRGYIRIEDYAQKNNTLPALIDNACATFKRALAILDIILDFTIYN